MDGVIMTTEPEVTKDDVIEALKEVYDPEIPLNIIDLGLVYFVGVEANEVAIEMTLTAQGCGMGPYIAQQAEWRVAEIPGVEDVEVELVWPDPPWSPELITEDGQRLLGLD
jgi:metal-sulfur cluster biosynthetic enzyme